MEQSAGRQDSVVFLLMRPREDIVCGIDRDPGCRVFPGQSWSVYAFLSAVLYPNRYVPTCQGSIQPYSALAVGKGKDWASPTTTFSMRPLKPAGQLHLG